MTEISKHCLKRKDNSEAANQCKTLNQIMYDAGYNAAIDDLEKLSGKTRIIVEYEGDNTWTA